MLGFDSLFNKRLVNLDNRMARDGVYTPQGGSPQPVKVGFDTEDGKADLFTTGARQERHMGEIRAADLTQKPVKGDVLVIDSVTYVVGMVEAINAGMVWQLGLEEQR